MHPLEWQKLGGAVTTIADQDAKKYVLFLYLKIKQ